MKKYLILVLCMLLISCGSTPTKKHTQQMTPAYVMTHPQKGTNYSELGGKNESSSAWVLDKDQCYKEVIAKGVVIDGETVTAFDVVDSFIDVERKREIQDFSSGNKPQTDLQKARRAAYQKVHDDTWVCLKKIGWSSELKLVPAGE